MAARIFSGLFTGQHILCLDPPFSRIMLLCNALEWSECSFLPGNVVSLKKSTLFRGSRHFCRHSRCIFKDLKPALKHTTELISLNDCYSKSKVDLDSSKIHEICLCYSCTKTDSLIGCSNVTEAAHRRTKINKTTWNGGCLSWLYFWWTCNLNPDFIISATSLTESH